MITVFVVRHCQAEGQAPDAPLTAEGRLQADRLAEFFAEESIDAIVCSPYERAHQSIAPLASKLGIKVTLDDRLIERTLSSRDLPDWRERLRQTYLDPELHYEGGESSTSATMRIRSALEEELTADRRCVMLVSHGNLISLLLKSYDNRFGFEQWAGLTNPDVYRLEIEGEQAVIRRVWHLCQ